MVTVTCGSTCGIIRDTVLTFTGTPGDIRLEPYSNSDLSGYSKVLVYFSNGVDRPGYGGICADSSYREEASVICNQLGYAYLDFAYRYQSLPCVCD